MSVHEAKDDGCDKHSGTLSLHLLFDINENNIVYLLHYITFLSTVIQFLQLIYHYIYIYIYNGIFLEFEGYCPGFSINIEKPKSLQHSLRSQKSTRTEKLKARHYSWRQPMHNNLIQPSQNEQLKNQQPKSYDQPPNSARERCVQRPPPRQIDLLLCILPQLVKSNHFSFITSLNLHHFTLSCLLLNWSCLYILSESPSCLLDRGPSSSLKDQQSCKETFPCLSSHSSENKDHF